MADVSKIKLPDNSEVNIKDARITGKGLWVASDMQAYSPMDTKNTYLEVTSDDNTVQIKSLTKTEKTNPDTLEVYDLITAKFSAPLVKQSETTNNNKFPLAIAGRMYNNLVSGNAYQTYYSQNIQANPATGVLYANDLNVGGVSAIQTLIASNPYIVGTQAAATNAWTGNAPFYTLVAGQAIRYKLPYDGNSSAATLELTLADGVSTTGAIAVKMNDSTSITTQYVANTVLYLTYDGTNWKHDADYNTNTNTIGYQLRSNSYSLPASAGFRRYRLLFTSADGTHFVPANTSTSINATAIRTPNQTPIDPFGKIVYYGTTTVVATDAAPATTVLWQQYTLDLGYSFNGTGSALVLTENTPVYIKCAPQSNGSAIIDSTTPYVQSLPSTEDGKIYIFLGIAYGGGASVEMLATHPVYYYKDSAIRLWTNAASSGGGSVTEIFTAEYGITSYAECEAAYSAGKALFCLVDEDPDYYTLPMTYWDDNGGPHASFTFIGAVGPEVFYKAVIDDTDTWDVSTFTFQTTSNLVTSISLLSTNSQYPSAKCVYDELSDKQDELVSGDNIKTVNGTTILGSGDVNTRSAVTTAPSGGFLPDQYYNLGTLTGTVTFSLASTVSGNINHYYWVFDTGSTAPTVTFPAGITWTDGTGPTVAANKHYEISILNNIAAFMEV